MTFEEIDNIEAGADLDALIAEKFSLHAVNVDSLKNYSTDITAAWSLIQLVQFRFNTYTRFKIAGFNTCLRSETPEFWVAEFIPSFGNGVIAEGHTAPLAICRAALKSEEVVYDR